MAVFQIFVSRKLAHGFCPKSFVSNFLRSLKLASWFSGQVVANRRFHLAKLICPGLCFVRSSQVSEIGYIFSAKVSASLVQAFLPSSFFLAK